jgi:hypothetical protein
MKDRLEDFIKVNRTAFDDAEPSASLWDRISVALFGKQRSLWNSVPLWRAAAIIFMCLSIYLLVPKERVSPANQIALKEFTDVEAFYVKQISEKVKIIDGFEESADNNFSQDFHQLQAMYLVLKEEMRARPSQKVKDALVLNLLVQIDLLNRQLNALDTVPSGGTEEKAKPSI